MPNKNTPKVKRYRKRYSSRILSFTYNPEGRIETNAINKKLVSNVIHRHKCNNPLALDSFSGNIIAASSFPFVIKPKIEMLVKKSANDPNWAGVNSLEVIGKAAIVIT
jgi:hypothetical protein